MVGIPGRLKVLAATGILAGGLGTAAISGAFAAPSPDVMAAASVTPTATSSNSTAPGTPEPERHFRGGPGQDFLGPLATFLGISSGDLQTGLRNGQTIAQIAQAHGKSAADVKTFLTNQLKTNLDQQVAAGKLTSQQETNILNNASSRFDNLINNAFKNGGPGRPFGRGFGPGGGPVGMYLQTVAQTLGMNETDVRTELQTGKTLAEIAQEHGKTASDLETAIINSIKPQLDKLMNQNFQQLRNPAGTRPGTSATQAPSTATPPANP